MPTLSEAVFQKFNDVNSDVDTTDEFIIIAPKLNVAVHGVPKVLVISAREVDKAGDPDDLQKVLSNVVELDISHNWISDLLEIGAIFQYAPKLRFLNLGFNNLSSPTLPSSPAEFPCTDSLQALILVGTNIPWNSVWFLLHHTKNVIELNLSLNQYDHVELQKVEQLETPDGYHQFENVDKLMFDGNPITYWEEISKLGMAFPNLSHLSCTECPIDNIPSNGGDHFKSLKTLWLSNARIAKLESFENLKHFAALVDLRVNGIPFLEKLSEEARRQHFIALLPNIVTLNRGRTITEDDRVTAERNFIRYYLDHSDPPARYNELKKVHGNVPKLVDIIMKPQTKAKLLIRFEEKEICRVDVNLKKTVTELKEFLEPIVGLAAPNMDLYYLRPLDLHPEREIMRYPNKQLYTYHMKDSDEILVFKKGTVICGSTTIYQ